MGFEDVEQQDLRDARCRHGSASAVRRPGYGASLGKAKQFWLLTFLRVPDKQGSKNDLHDFEHQGFIKRVEGDWIEFDYRGLDRRLVRIVTPADVIWTCELLAQLSDEQWHDAFMAGG